MKKLNFKQPKYILPIIIFPFLFLGFYLYKDTLGKEEEVVVVEEGIQTGIAVSSEVHNRDLEDKMGAYENRYRGADGYTAISGIETEKEEFSQFDDLYSEAEKRRLDSVDQALTNQIRTSQQSMRTKTGYVPNKSQGSSSDQELLRLLASNTVTDKQEPKEDKAIDPIHMMREQYRLLDSFERANDPEHKEELFRQQQQERAEKEAERLRLSQYSVKKSSSTDDGFNTIVRQKDNAFIKAIIDENISGYAGSRIRIRLLEDIRIGNHLIKNGTYLYALISGFSEQRVKLNIVSVMYQNNILPISLSIYDLDGMEGLYVPASAFREFTKELGASSLQGINIQSNTANQQELLMSSLQKAFQSTSQAVAKAIRKNKAKFKYNTFVYLIDTKN